MGKLSGTPPPKRAGFSLMELLTVIAIMGILGALLLPMLGALQVRARQTQSQALFSQLATACMNYRTDYGYYPLFGQTRETGDTAIRFKERGGDVYRTLTAFDPVTGQSILETPKQLLNHRGRTYFTFAESSLDGEYVVDAFGNRDILMVVDTEGNGQIQRQFVNGLDPVHTVEGNKRDAYTPELTRNLRQPIILYSAGGGAGREVTTWAAGD